MEWSAYKQSFGLSTDRLLCMRVGGDSGMVISCSVVNDKWMNVYLGGKVDARFKVADGRGRSTSLNSFALSP